MTGYTYFCIDSHGHSYSRYSAKHDAPRYRSAQIYRDRGTTHAVNKAHVSYSKGEVGPLPNFLRSHPRFEHEVVAVRAYPGRHLAGEPRQPEVTDEMLAAFSFGGLRAVRG